MTARAAAEESRFKVNPNPPEVGKSVEITYVGPATEIEYQIDANTSVKVTPDANGKFKINPLPKGKELTLSDNRGLPGYLYVKILEVD